MWAIRKLRREPGLDLDEVQKPEVGHDDVLVRVEAASLCGTDLQLGDRTTSYAARFGRTSMEQRWVATHIVTPPIGSSPSTLAQPRARRIVVNTESASLTVLN